MSGGIFISYRRSDSRHAAGRLADELDAAFGAANVFRDIEGIEIGVNFEQALETALNACEVMLVVIGPQWLDVRDEVGNRRLEKQGDWTRAEVATALKRNIRVVPVLLEGTPLPSAEQLPEDLRELVNRQQFLLSDVRWRGDVQTLIEKLARLPGLSRVDQPRAAALPMAPVAPVAPLAPAASGSRKSMLIGMAAGGALVLALLLWAGGAFDGSQADNAATAAQTTDQTADQNAQAEQVPANAPELPASDAAAQ